MLSLPGLQVVLKMGVLGIPNPPGAVFPDARGDARV